MNLLRQIQLARDRKHHRRQPGGRTAAAQGRLRSLGRATMGPSISPICTRQSARSMPSFADPSACAPAEPVAIYRTNDRHCFHWFLAIIRAGGIAVPLNPLLSLGEVRRILADSGTEILVTDKAVFERNIRDRSALNVRAWIQADDEPETLDGFLRVDDSGAPFPPATIDPAATVAVFHTSGTSGISQGSGSFKPRSARRARLHSVCRAFSRPQRSCAGRAALVAHHGRQHCALWLDGRNPRLLSRAFRRRRRPRSGRALRRDRLCRRARHVRAGWSTAIPIPSRLAQRARVAFGQRPPALRSSHAPARIRRSAPAAGRAAHSSGAPEWLRHGGAGRPGHDGHRAVALPRQRPTVLSRSAVSRSHRR